MENWKIFEKDCTEYLNDNYSEHAHFKHMGEENSNVSDILVHTKNNEKFYIEAKKSPCQSGQFVLLPDLEKQRFIYSTKNKFPLNEYSNLIIQYMDDNFHKFTNAGTSGKTIEFPNCQYYFSQWIISFYKSKKVKYIITNNFNIIDINDISKFFDISAKYRIKKSGSSKVPKKESEIILSFIQNNYSIYDHYKDKKGSLFVKSKENLANVSFNYDNSKYKFMNRDKNVFEIRKLSNTYNLTVIFSLVLKNNE